MSMVVAARDFINRVLDQYQSGIVIRTAAVQDVFGNDFNALVKKAGEATPKESAAMLQQPLGDATNMKKWVAVTGKLAANSSFTVDHGPQINRSAASVLRTWGAKRNFWDVIFSRYDIRSRIPLIEGLVYCSTDYNVPLDQLDPGSASVQLKYEIFKSAYARATPGQKAEVVAAYNRVAPHFNYSFTRLRMAADAPLARVQTVIDAHLKSDTARALMFAGIFAVTAKIYLVVQRWATDKVLNVLIPMAADFLTQKGYAVIIRGIDRAIGEMERVVMSILNFLGRFLITRIIPYFLTPFVKQIRPYIATCIPSYMIQTAFISITGTCFAFLLGTHYKMYNQAKTEIAASTTDAGLREGMKAYQMWMHLMTSKKLQATLFARVV
jgi:hypothetical protein